MQLPLPLLRTWAVLALISLFTARQASAASNFLYPEKLAEMDAAILQAVADHKCPGGVLWFEHCRQSYHKAYGNRSLVPSVEPMTEDTIFDAASLTKVIACTPAAMLLVERGQLDLEAPVHRYIPEFQGGDKEKVTIRNLMTHTSGLRPDIETRTDWHGQAAAIEKACQEKLQTVPGTVVRYSDINMFLLGEVIQRITKTPLEVFVAREIYGPLKMADTGYLPPKEKFDRVAPTEVVNGKPWRGIVHDPTARKMGGVAGHAGLFVTAADLARYARMLLNLGELDGVRILKPETVKLMTSVQTPPGVEPRRGLGWDIDSSYSGPRGKLFPLGSYGHTGWTGGSIWIDPFSQSFVIFLSNRNHPTEEGSVIALRAKLGTLAAEAIPDFNFAYVPGALPAMAETDKAPSRASRFRRNLPVQSSLKTLNGIDVLKKENFAPLKGLRVALITNHTGHDRERNPTIDLLKNAPEVQLKVLFSPEHGIRGLMDERIGDSTDEKTGLPIYSLYGENRKPKPEQLKDIDALVFDIQDVGCRFYTYISTMGLCMEAASENHKKYFVLDRVNPITGAAVEGPVVSDSAKFGFVGYYKIPLRYGMTIGELAKMYHAEKNCSGEMTVIPLQNWKRDAWLDETGLPWTNPSPNMRNLAEAILYPGIGLLESVMSVGRGTDTPFEVIGAPYIDDVKFAAELNSAGLPGIRFIPIQFTPTYSVHKDKLCRGVYMMLTDRDHCPVVDVGLVISKTLCRLYPNDFHPEKISRLLLHPQTLEAIKADKSLQEIHASWQGGLEEFQKRRAKYLIY